MPINKETIISVFDDKLTLMQWLKTINKALEDAVLTGVEITKKGNATLSFKFTFEDGTCLETNDLVLQQGESVANAFIQNGHLYLTLTNGTNLDAGNVKPVSNFSIDANQHLIVNYGDGTSQDLGAIFNGNVNISGTLDATKVTGNEIVEKMAGYSFLHGSGYTSEGVNIVYAGAVKNGNKITFSIFFNVNLSVASQSDLALGQFEIPSEIDAKIYPFTLGGSTQFVDIKESTLMGVGYATIACVARAFKPQSNRISVAFLPRAQVPSNADYIGRYEVTFLLSDNLAQ